MAVTLEPWANYTDTRFGVFSLDDEQWSSDVQTDDVMFLALDQLARRFVQAQCGELVILEPGSALMESLGGGLLEAVHLANEKQVVRCIQECVDFDYENYDDDSDAGPGSTMRQFNVLPVPNSVIGEDDWYHEDYSPGIAIVTKDDMIFIPEHTDRLKEKGLSGADIPKYLYDAHDLLRNNGDEYINRLINDYCS